LTDIALKDREWVPAILFVPVAVEECEAFVVWRSIEQGLNVVDNLGREEGLAGAS
jgi:hypothetical protein